MVTLTVQVTAVQNKKVINKVIMCVKVQPAALIRTYGESQGKTTDADI